MTSDDSKDKFSNVTQVVSDPLRFKMKLNIGEDAYKSLKIKKYFLDAVDAGNGVVTGMAVAKSSVVASTFFASSGLLGAIGLGTAATPLGWAIAAGVVGAGMSLTVGKFFVRGGTSRVSVIPDFINTPLDLLAVGLFDMIGMLGVKLAAIDGEIKTEELNKIKNHFITEWGYDDSFVDTGLKQLVADKDSLTTQEIAKKLAVFQRENPDCNYQSMSREIIIFLQEISEADGVLDERELLAIEKIESIFEEVGSIAFTVRKTADKAAHIGKTGVAAVSKEINAVGKSAVSGAKSIGKTISSKLKK